MACGGGAFMIRSQYCGVPYGVVMLGVYGILLGGKLVCDPEQRAIRSVLLNRTIISKTKDCIIDSRILSANSV